MSTRSLAFHTLLWVGFLIELPAGAEQVRFRKGDIVAAVAQGRVLHFDKDGKLRQILDTRSGAFCTGMCFDAEGTLYVTNFGTNSMSTFSRRGELLKASWGGPFNLNAESCVVDKQGNVYTGEADGDRDVRKFSQEGRPLETFGVATGSRGTDWIELAADQCRVFYTSEGWEVKIYDVCRQRQLDDFVTGLEGPCYALRLRDNGELMVTCQTRVYRLDRGGSIVKIYVISGESLFAMNLDPDGRTFLTAGQESGNVYRVDIESGRGTEIRLFNVQDHRDSDVWKRGLGLGGVGGVGGLAVYGELTVGGAKVLGESEPPQTKYNGSVEFGEPSAIDFGRMGHGSEAARQIDFGTSRTQGIPLARVTTDLDLSGAVLEIETSDGWRALGKKPVEVPLDLGASRQLPLRLRVGRCPRGSTQGKHFVFVEARDAEGKSTKLDVPVEVDVEAASWLDCWWPVLAGILGLVLVAVIFHGFVSPSRFSRQVGLVLSPEEDLDEGFFHPIRAIRGSGSGFYRDARIYVSSGYHLTSRPKDALVRLRAEGNHVKVQPLHGCPVERQNADGEWEPLSVYETGMRFGVLYRNEMKTLFFALRNG